MTIALVKQAISVFLQKPDPQVLCIRGKWGVGKTYIWNEVFAEAVRKKEVALPYFSYVSLFGLQSIDEVRQAVFENSVPTTKGEIRPTIESFRDNIERLGRAGGQKIAKVLPYAKVPGIDQYVTNVAGGFRQIVSLAVSKTIICFDDFERKKIDGKDLLGLVSQLRDQKDCKAVIILNEDALSDTEKKDFSRYFEKVVDIPITFSPSPEECATISIPGTGFVNQQIRENVIKLGISNIRIIYRIRNISQTLIGIIDDFSNEVKKQAFHTLTLLVWSKYADEAIPMENIQDRAGRMRALMGSDNRSEDEKIFDKKLKEYGFTDLDEFDLAIKLGVERGFFDEAEILKQANQQNSRNQAADAQQALQLAWRAFHDSFDKNDAKQVVDGIYNAYKSNMKYVSRANLDDAIGIFRTLGYNSYASELIASYIDLHRESIHDVHEHANPFNPGPSDGEFRKALSLVAVPLPQKSIRETLIGIYRGKMNQADITAACALTVDELYCLFSELRGDDLYPVVEGSLFFRRVSNATDSQKMLTGHAIEALERLGKESAINAIRVRKFGVEINSPTE